MSTLKPLLEHLTVIRNLYKKEGTNYLINIDKCVNFNKFYKEFQRLRAEDFQFEKNLLDYFDPSKTKYVRIINDEDLGMGIFLFPNKNNLPIHDHPLTAVATKVLRGKLQVQSYQVKNFDKQQKIHDEIIHGKNSREHIMNIIGDGIEVQKSPLKLLNLNDVTYLTPIKENAHHIQGIDNCAMLDVFFPNTEYRVFYTEFEDKLQYLIPGSTFNVQTIDYPEIGRNNDVISFLK